MTDTTAPVDPIAPAKTVRTTFEGVMISLPEEGVESGGTAVYLSPRLETFLEYDWRRQPLPDLTDDTRDALRAQLVDELKNEFGLDEKWAEAFADGRLFFNRS
jgi:hypothetical protein